MEKKRLPNDVLFETVGAFLGEGRQVLFRPSGRSMLPFIRGDRDSVVLERPGRPVEVGDIILAKVEDRYVMHRVWSVEGDRIVMMGDGNLRGKESLSAADVIGFVSEIVKPGGRRVKPGRGVLWRRLLPVRRLLLAVMKRTLFRRDCSGR